LAGLAVLAAILGIAALASSGAGLLLDVCRAVALLIVTPTVLLRRRRLLLAITVRGGFAAAAAPPMLLLLLLAPAAAGLAGATVCPRAMPMAHTSSRRPVALHPLILLPPLGL
jgi:hypothetical protein